jgi:hypothetical protein
LVLVLVLV